MKNFIKTSVILLVFSASLFSCDPESKSEDTKIEKSENQSVFGKGRRTHKPSSNNDR